MSRSDWITLQRGLRDWQAVHSAELRFDEAGCLVLNDGRGDDFHLIRIHDPQAVFAYVRVEVSVAPAPGGDADFYFNAWGGRDLAVVARDGRVLRRDPDVEVRAAVRDDGFIDITLTYFSVHETVNIGAFRGSAVYPGSSADQFLIARVELSVQRPATRLGGDRLVFVDVGAEGGWQEKWRRLAPDLDMTFVEPAPETAHALRADYPQCRVLEVGLLDRSCARTLNITRLTGCSSLLLPDAELLRRWTVAPLFDVMRTVEVRCERYDALHAAGAAPRPEALKIDVQGVEYEVLQGFGDLLFGCLGIELEAHFYPIYRGEKLLHEIVAYLSEYGLTLRRLEPQLTFDGDLVEANVYFTRRLDADAPESARRKLALIEEVWELALHQVGADLVRSVGLEPRIGGAA